MSQHWRAGNPIMLRFIRKGGHAGMVLPVTVVQDTDDLVALYLAPETVCTRRAGKRGGPRNRVLIEDLNGYEEWTWTDHRRLILWHPPAGHAVSLFWRDADDVFLDWYVDVLEPLRRTSLGFDTRDLVLDVVVHPDRTWHLKDEDELAWMQERGMLAPHNATSIREEAARTTALLEAHDPIFAESWITWRPDPAWQIPDLSGGWEEQVDKRE